MIPDEEADRLAAIAIELVARVRDLDPHANAQWLTAVTRSPSDWLGLCFVLAAAVPTDRSWWQLTSWTREAQAQRAKPGGPDTWENIERRREVLDAALRPGAHREAARVKPRLLDLFCGAGGAARGYQLAGFHVTGVDINPQPRYAGDEFVQADALTYPLDGFDVIHASPTCQRKARVTAWRGDRDSHPNTLTPTLTRLRAQPRPFVVENVVEAADELRGDLLLCGTQFGLTVRRHRIFECGNWDGYVLTAPCECYRNPDVLPFIHKGERAYADALGCEWMTNREARQAVPPAYARFIGEQLLAELVVAA